MTHPASAEVQRQNPEELSDRNNKRMRIICNSHPLTGIRTRDPERAGRHASASVEFALIAPILGLLIVGMFELSRGIQVKQILSDAARKGCATGAKPGKTNTDINNDVNNILTDNSISTSAATIAIYVRGQPYDSSNPPKQFDMVAVKVSIPVSAIYWVTSYFLTNSEVESETYVMMRQG
jgi:hypothetical protein